MATYQVMMTLETPQLRSPRSWEIKLASAKGHLRLFAGEGRLAVTGPVREESPADAAMVVIQAVLADWDKSDGPVKLLSWTAHRDRVFAGLGRRPDSTSAIEVSSRGRFWDDEGPDDEGGSAGVREPRRPLPGPGSMSAARANEPAPAWTVDLVEQWAGWTVGD